MTNRRADRMYEQIYGRLWSVWIRETSHPEQPEVLIKTRALSQEQAEENALAIVAKRWALTGVTPTLKVVPAP